MAQQGTQTDKKELANCSICLDLMKDPVTIPCGHNYCMDCIRRHWDGEDRKETYSCPQCRQTFRPRPDLKKNTMLAELVEEVKKTGVQPSPDDLCYAGPGDVFCDFCTGRKLKAVKSCLQCLVSYCQQHLQPHYNIAALKNHKLVDPSKKLQENICSRHNEVMKIFCRSDQQCICYLCTLEEHKGHDTVSAAAERTERQENLKPSVEKNRQRIQDREEDVKVLQQEVEAINQSADKVVKDTDKISKDLIGLIEENISNVKRQIRSQQETEVYQAKDLLKKVQEEITELERKDAELEQLCRNKDDCQFLHMFPLISGLSETKWPRPKPRHLTYFENVTTALSELDDKLQSFLREELPKLSQTITEVDVLLPQPEPTTRGEFLKHSCNITLDPNTAGLRLLLSDGNRKATFISNRQTYPSHPDRFMNKSQVLSREALTGRHYWEVEWSGFGVYVAVAYKDISRKGDESEFGNNDKSWAFRCSQSGYGITYMFNRAANRIRFGNDDQSLASEDSNNCYELRHNSSSTFISGPRPSKIGVYLDHRAGILSFYNVTDTMTLLHRIQTTFTQPLHVGFRTNHSSVSGSSAMFWELT